MIKINARVRKLMVKRLDLESSDFVGSNPTSGTKFMNIIEIYFDSEEYPECKSIVLLQNGKVRYYN